MAKGLLVSGVDQPVALLTNDIRVAIGDGSSGRFRVAPIKDDLRDHMSLG